MSKTKEPKISPFKTRNELTIDEVEIMQYRLKTAGVLPEVLDDAFHASTSLVWHIERLREWQRGHRDLEEQLEAERQKSAELLDALEGILDIGKRDMSNDKYDGYFHSAKQAIEKYNGAKCE